MAYDALIFTDFNETKPRMVNKKIGKDVYELKGEYEKGWPIKTNGPYKIAQSLREIGLTATVIPNFNSLVIDYKKEFLQYINENIDENTKFVGLSTNFLDYVESHASDYHEVYNFIKSKGPLIIMGGTGFASKQMLKEFHQIDHHIMGYAENSIRIFLDKFYKKQNVPREIRIDIKGLGYDFRNGAKTFHETDLVTPGEVLPMEISRGCKFKCKFCAFPLIGRDYRDETYLRHPDKIYEEFMFNYENWGTTLYNFSCETFNESTEKLKMVQKVIDRLPFDIEFNAYARIELIHNDLDQIKILKDMGCRGIHFGLETLNHKAGRAIGKGMHPTKIMETLQYCRKIVDDDILLFASFIAGLPYDNKQELFKWARHLIKDETGLHCYYIKELQIYPYDRINPDKNVFWSEFSKEPEKYGYKFDENDNWYSDICSYKEAIRWCEIINSLSPNYKITNWHYLINRGLGMSHQFIMDSIKRKIPRSTYETLRSELMMKKRTAEIKQSLVLEEELDIRPALS